MSLRWETVTKRFGRELALEGVDLHVRTGDRYGLVGHNGAGKSTLLRIAVGLVRPDAGRVLVDGIDASREPREARARIGAAIEAPGFHDGRDARTNLVWLGRLQGLEAAAARAEAERVLELVGLSHTGRKRVRAFSLGMRQRLSLAQALLGSPAYLLLDEPTNGLDPEGIARILGLLRRLSEDGTTVLVSSHRLGELDGWCTRVGMLERGHVRLEEEPRALLARAGAECELEVEPEERAREVLSALEVDVHPAAEPGRLLVVDGRHAPSELVAALVRSGCAVSSFAPRRRRLEELLAAPTAASAGRGSAAGVAPAGAPAGEAVPDRQEAASAAGGAVLTASGARGVPARGAASAPAAPPGMRGSSSGEAAPVGAGAPGGERDRSHGPPATGGPTPTPRGGASDAAASAGAASAGGPVGGASPARRAPARPLQRVVGYELRRLGGSFGARVLFVLPALLGAAAVLRRALEVRIEAGRVASGQLYSTTAVNAFEGLAVGLRAALPLLAGVAVGWATQAIAGELSRGTLANVAARPITRTQLGLGKLLAALLAALGGLVLAVGTCAAVAGLAFDYEGVVEILPNGKTYPYVTAQELLAPIPSVLVAPLVALVALTVLGFLVGALVRSGTAALALGLGGVLLLELARAPARLLGHEALIPTAHLPTPLGAGSSVDAWLELCRGISGASLPPVAPALGSAALWGGAALVLSLLAVRRRSIA